MKLGLIVPGFSASESDWCIPALLNLVRELSRRHEVHVFALRYPSATGSSVIHGARVHSFGGGLASGLGRLPLLGRTLTSIASEHRRGAFHVLHGFWADEPGFMAVAAGRLLDVPSVVSLMGGELVALPEIGYGGQLSRFNRWLTGAALGSATRVTVGSSSLSWIARAHVRAERLHQMPLGVDAQMFCPGPALSGPLLEGAIRLLHVASLVAIKDQATLLRALGEVVAQVPGVRLHVVGDGPLRPDLERLAGSLGVADHVTFHGGVAHERLPDYYRAADLCVLSSRYESQGMVVLEAAACGRTTIGTAVGLLPDLGAAVRAVPIGDAMLLSEALLSVIEDPIRQTIMGQRARACVESSYSLACAMERMSVLYAGISEDR